MKKNSKRVASMIAVGGGGALVINIIFSVVLIVCLVGTIVAGVFTGLKTGYEFNAEEVKTASPTASVYEQGISVPYQTAENVSYTVHVSPKGDNANDGSDWTKAVTSINRAQSLTRAWYEDGNKGNAMILLDDGEYYIDSTVALVEADFAGGELYLRSRNPNKATVSGSKQVAKSAITEEQDEMLGRVWKIPYTEKINQLYVNDTYGVRARHPNSGDEFRILESDDILREIIIDSQDVEGFEEKDFVGATMTVAVMWSESYIRIDGLKREGDVSRVQITGDDNFIFTRGGLTLKARCGYHFENSKAFLDREGEWYFSDEEDTIYYLPYEYETVENTTIRIPQTEVLLSVTGEKESKAIGLHIEGINFKYTANGVVDGKVGGQANRNDNIATKRISGGLNDGRPISAISMEYVKNVSFNGNVFACLGGGGIDFLQGAEDVTIEKNMFRSVGGNGILAGAVNYDITMVSTDERTFNKNLKIENNYFTEIGWQDYDACAVILNYAVDSFIRYNTINNVLYSGISVGWGWRTTDYPFLRNVEISYNRLTNCNALLSDGGPIYTIGCQSNTKIINNYIGESYNSVWKFPEDIPSKDAEQVWWANAGIYLDSASGGATEETKMLVHNNYVAQDVNSQQYEDVNAGKGEGSSGDKGKTYFEIIRASESDKKKIYNGSGVREDGFSLLPKTAVLSGSRTNSKTLSTVFGFGLGSINDGGLIVRGKDGKLTQVAYADIEEWTDRWIIFNTENYQSGEVFLLCKNGVSSNKIYATFNVDRDYCMYGRFEQEWGDLSGLALLRTRALDFELKTAKSSSDSGLSAGNILDGHTATVWEKSPESVEADADGAWVSAQLKNRGKVQKFLIYARAEVDQPNCRQNFKVYGLVYKKGEDGKTLYETDAAGEFILDSDGKKIPILEEILLYETPEDDVPVYASNGVFILDIENSEHKETLFVGFKIQKKVTEKDSYLCLAEIAAIGYK